MGAINYGTSEYITIGLKPYNYDDYREEENGEIDYDQMNFDYECDKENVENVLDRYSFNFFNVYVEYGYYEGFYLNIKTNFDFYNWEDKADALKEATQLKNMLIECCDVGLCEVWPGWCTSYKSYSESIKNIKDAIWQIKQDIKSTETWLQEQKKAI